MQPSSDSIGGQLTSMSSAIHWQKISLKGKGNIQVLYALYNLLDYLRNTLRLWQQNCKVFLMMQVLWKEVQKIMRRLK